MRPNLTKDISIESFKDYYWLKEELQLFFNLYSKLL
ncbi:hypothetical protein GGQ92_000912 [Gracilibacillus halotolerans]|uniref:Uncharacterized protein n=1 Tax=Gracilibacillus halotolerans TaxID=74386 RepID=A0A841RHK2_9BACI|nr:hypothetical protein [Gracilibacillus halotolerans]